jgi:transcriptional regulator with XRE-family HTH domain
MVEGGLDEIGQELRRLRLTAGLSGVEFATRAGVPQPTVSRVETGRRVSDAEVIVRLFGALGLEPADADRLASRVREAYAASVPRRADAGVSFRLVRGGRLRRSNFSAPWAKALDKAGLPADTHIHDPRHTGNTFAAETGASLAELMNRMGHASTRAAQIYLHARKERDREIATTLDRMAKRELKKARKRKPDAPEKPTGT